GGAASRLEIHAGCRGTGERTAERCIGSELSPSALFSADPRRIGSRWQRILKVFRTHCLTFPGDSYLIRDGFSAGSPPCLFKEESWESSSGSSSACSPV